jgi:hypothetical protein
MYLPCLSTVDIHNISMSHARATQHEIYQLGSSEDGWNLAGTTFNTGSRTHYAGSGRPSLVKRVYNESSTDSDYQADEDTSSKEEVEFNENSFFDEELKDEEEVLQEKPSCTRVILEIESLKKCMEKNCQCPK